MKKNWQGYLCFILPVIFCLSYFVFDRFIISYDTTHLFYVMKRWYWSNILNGHLPLWNEATDIGVYQWSSPALAILSPFTAIFYSLFHSVLAEEFQLAFFSGIAGFGMYKLCFYFTNSKDNSFLFGLVYAFSGVFLSLADRSPIYISASLYPWALFLYFYSFHSKKIIQILPLTFILS